MKNKQSWIDQRFPLTKVWNEHLAEYYTPRNFNFWYFFGSLAILMLVMQFVTGIFLTMHFKPDSANAFASVEYIMRDVEWGISNNIVGYIKNIRDDGKLDISLQPVGKESAGDLNSENIIKLLKQNDNFLPYNYKTDVAIVKKVFGISKKAYKRTLTTLIDKKIITLDDKGISIIL